MGEIQADKKINIVMHQGPQGVNVNPEPQIVLEPSDTILVIAPAELLLKLEELNNSKVVDDGAAVAPVLTPR